MATAAASSLSEPEVEPQAGPEAEGEEDEVKPASVGRKVLPGPVSAEAAEAQVPGCDLQQEGVSESDGDEEDAMASSAESSAGEDEWEYDDEEEKNQLEIERLEEQVGRGGWRAPFPWVPQARSAPLGPPWLWRPLRSPGRRLPPCVPASRAHCVSRAFLKCCVEFSPRLRKQC